MDVKLDNIATVELAIITGIYDDDEGLDRLLAAIRRRFAMNQMLKLNSLITGQIITLSEKITPKILARCPAEVVDFPDKGDAVRVKLLSSRSSKWQYGDLMTINKNLIGELR